MDEWIRWVVGGFCGTVILVFTWLFKIVSGKANGSSTDRRFEQLMDELKHHRTELKSHETEDRNMHKDVLAEIRETNRHLSMTNATLSNLVGRFDATNGHR